MTLATATPDGRPSTRIVLLKGFDDRGFVFSSEDSAAYFHSRPVGSQLSAWASKQSEVIDSRRILDARLESNERRGLPLKH